MARNRNIEVKPTTKFSEQRPSIIRYLADELAQDADRSIGPARKVFIGSGPGKVTSRQKRNLAVLRKAVDRADLNEDTWGYTDYSEATWIKVRLELDRRIQRILESRGNRARGSCKQVKFTTRAGKRVSFKACK